MSQRLIQLGERDVGKRAQTIQRMLRPISSIAHGPACSRGTAPDAVVLGAHAGTRGSGAYRDWRFPTSKPTIQAMYFELWRSLGGTSHTLYMDRAYMTIYRVDREDRTERAILSLHSDPNEPRGNEHWQYKHCLHLHIEAAEAPIPHAHIALCDGFTDSVLTSTDSLTDAIERAVRMVADEVLAQL